MNHARQFRRGLLAATTLGLASFAAHAQMPDARLIPLQKQLELCRAGHTWETRDACIEETMSVYRARRAGQIQAGENFTANALARCNIYRDQENTLACRARVMGLGQVEGSVAGGGLLRIYEYQVPVQQAGAGQPRSAVQPQTERLGAPGARLQQYQPMDPILQRTPAFPMF